MAKKLTKAEMDAEIMSLREKQQELKKALYEETEKYSEKQISSMMSELMSCNKRLEKLRKQSRELYNNACGYTDVMKSLGGGAKFGTLHL